MRQVNQPETDQRSVVAAQDPRDQARFHPKLKIYLSIQALLACFATIVGIALLPISIVVAVWWARRYFEVLECTVRPRALVVKKGIQFRTEKTIPLDKIQDVSVRHGPILNWLGLSKLVVETAGQGSEGAAASLIGVIEPLAFRDHVLETRDHFINASDGRAGAGPEPAADADDIQLLRDIRDSVRRIEDALRSDSAVDT